jgi:hypothetical protein
VKQIDLEALTELHIFSSPDKEKVGFGKQYVYTDVFPANT